MEQKHGIPVASPKLGHLPRASTDGCSFFFTLSRIESDSWSFQGSRSRAHLATHIYAILCDSILVGRWSYSEFYAILSSGSQKRLFIQEFPCIELTVFKMAFPSLDSIIGT